MQRTAAVAVCVRHTSRVRRGSRRGIDRWEEGVVALEDDLWPLYLSAHTHTYVNTHPYQCTCVQGAHTDTYELAHAHTLSELNAE